LYRCRGSPNHGLIFSVEKHIIFGSSFVRGAFPVQKYLHYVTKWIKYDVFFYGKDKTVIGRPATPIQTFCCYNTFVKWLCAFFFVCESTRNNTLPQCNQKEVGKGRSENFFLSLFFVLVLREACIEKFLSVSRVIMYFYKIYKSNVKIKCRVSSQCDHIFFSL
jgi:hypothetical protein